MDLGETVGKFLIFCNVPQQPRLVVKDNITARGALAVGQTLRLGSFIMTARSAAAPTMTSRVIKNSLQVGSEFAE